MKNREGWGCLELIGSLVTALALVFLTGLLIKIFWNALMPDIFGLPEVSYWQALELLALRSLFFLGGGKSVLRGRKNEV